MRLKLDENLDVRLIPFLQRQGLDASTVFEEGLSGASDEDVLSAAVREGRTLLTLDLDFSNPLRFGVAGSPGILVLRVHRPLIAVIEATLRAALPRLVSSEIRGKLWIVEPGRIREYAPD